MAKTLERVIVLATQMWEISLVQTRIHVDTYNMIELSNYMLLDTEYYLSLWYLLVLKFISESLLLGNSWYLTW